jgi:phage baseplate assembly protein W
MSTRADTITQTQKIPDLFSDFLADLTPHPITKDVARVKNDLAIKRAVKNIIFTTYGERLFQPTIGGNIRKVLFEPSDNIMIEELRYQITNSLRQNEPRINLMQVDIATNERMDTVNIAVYFMILNNQIIQSVDLILRRIR